LSILEREGLVLATPHIQWSQAKGRATDFDLGRAQDPFVLRQKKRIHNVGKKSKGGKAEQASPKKKIKGVARSGVPFEKATG